MNETELVHLVIAFPRSWWRRALRRPCRSLVFSSESFTRDSARAYADELQSEWPNVAVALVGDDWVEKRTPLSGSGGVWLIEPRQP